MTGWPTGRGTAPNAEGAPSAPGTGTDIHLRGRPRSPPNCAGPGPTRTWVTPLREFAPPARRLADGLGARHPLPPPDAKAGPGRASLSQRSVHPARTQEIVMTAMNAGRTCFGRSEPKEDRIHDS